MSRFRAHQTVAEVSKKPVTLEDNRHGLSFADSNPESMRLKVRQLPDKFELPFFWYDYSSLMKIFGQVFDVYYGVLVA